MYKNLHKHVKINMLNVTKMHCHTATCRYVTVHNNTKQT